MPAPAKNPFFDDDHRTRLQERLNANGRRLSSRDAEVLMLRAALLDDHHHTHDEIAARFKLTPNRIRQIEKAALTALDQQPDQGPYTPGLVTQDTLGWPHNATFEQPSGPIGQVIPLITPGVPLTPMQARTVLATRFARTGDRIGALIESWLATMRPNTCTAYRKDVELYFDYCIARDLDPLEVRIQDFTPYRDWLLQQTNPDGTLYAKATRKRKIDAVSSLYRFLADVDAIDRSPVTRNARIKHKPPRRDKTLTRAQVDAIIDDAATGHRTIGARCAVLIIKLLFGMGMRVTEVCDLEIDQLTTVLDDDGNPVRGITFTVKGGEEDTRGIPHDIDQDHLTPYLAERPAPATPADAAALLLDRKGRRLCRHQLFRLVQRAYARGLIDKKATPHFARHTFNDRAIEAKVSAERRQRALGHKSLTTTQHYGQQRNTITNDPAHEVARMLAAAPPNTEDIPPP